MNFEEAEAAASISVKDNPAYSCCYRTRASEADPLAEAETEPVCNSGNGSIWTLVSVCFYVQGDLVYGEVE